nr:MAG TPA: hypothetical protein [Caudoviricetes sp.]DAX96191.1 MAG TPA: hypothetical protein [Bacteriophage sp.]
MKFEDLHDVEVGDILKCKDLDVTFEVVEIDMATKLTPIRVKMLSGYSSTELVSGVSTSDRFDESYKQWLYANPENLRAYVPCLEDSVDVSKLITLDRLEPLVDVTEPEYAVPTESEEFEAITASQAAELSKRKILRELMDRIREAISSNFGVFELKVPDLDLDPVTPELEELGYVVRFSMQDDEFTILWEPKL